MSQTTARLGLPLIVPAQAQKHVTHNEALSLVDLLVQAVIEATGAIAPPGVPAEGAAYALGSNPSGAWAGQADTLARWQDGGWWFTAPADGWLVYDRGAQRLRVRAGGVWVGLAEAMDFDRLEHLGVNTGGDAVNRLSVAAPATLLSHEGAGHQLKINKAASGDTASLIFQTGWTGYAEMGLAGNNRFAIKVSDGVTWKTALDFAATGIASGEAVQASASDATAGRLLKTGAFGLGETGSTPLLADIDALGTASGRYRTNLTTTGTFPAAAQSYCYIDIARYSATNIHQTCVYVGASGAHSRLYHRSYNEAASSWLPWSMVFNQYSLVGTVSQSAGVVTGAGIERGTNANGYYTRFADGTQICWVKIAPSAAIGTAFLGGYKSADFNWTFPASFVGTPVVSGAPEGNSAFSMGFNTSGASSTKVYFTAITSQAATGLTGSLLAVGRWY